MAVLNKNGYKKSNENYSNRRYYNHNEENSFMHTPKYLNHSNLYYSQAGRPDISFNEREFVASTLVRPSQRMDSYFSQSYSKNRKGYNKRNPPRNSDYSHNNYNKNNSKFYDQHSHNNYSKNNSKFYDQQRSWRYTNQQKPKSRNYRKTDRRNDRHNLTNCGGTAPRVTENRKKSTTEKSTHNDDCNKTTFTLDFEGSQNLLNESNSVSKYSCQENLIFPPNIAADSGPSEISKQYLPCLSSSKTSTLNSDPLNVLSSFKDAKLKGEDSELHLNTSGKRDATPLPPTTFESVENRNADCQADVADDIDVFSIAENTQTVVSPSIPCAQELPKTDKPPEKGCENEAEELVKTFFSQNPPPSLSPITDLDRDQCTPTICTQMESGTNNSKSSEKVSAIEQNVMEERHSTLFPLKEEWNDYFSQESRPITIFDIQKNVNSFKSSKGMNLFSVSLDSELYNENELLKGNEVIDEMTPHGQNPLDSLSIFPSCDSLESPSTYKSRIMTTPSSEKPSAVHFPENNLEYNNDSVCTDERNGITSCIANTGDTLTSTQHSQDCVLIYDERSPLKIGNDDKSKNTTTPESKNLNSELDKAENSRERALNNQEQHQTTEREGLDCSRTSEDMFSTYTVKIEDLFRNPTSETLKENSEKNDDMSCPSPNKSNNFKSLEKLENKDTHFAGKTNDFNKTIKHKSTSKKQVELKNKFDSTVKDVLKEIRIFLNKKRQDCINQTSSVSLHVKMKDILDGNISNSKILQFQLSSVGSNDKSESNSLSLSLKTTTNAPSHSKSQDYSDNPACPKSEPSIKSDKELYTDRDSSCKVQTQTFNTKSLIPYIVPTDKNWWKKIYELPPSLFEKQNAKALDNKSKHNPTLESKGSLNSESEDLITKHNINWQEKKCAINKKIEREKLNLFTDAVTDSVNGKRQTNNSDRTEISNYQFDIEDDNSVKATHLSFENTKSTQTTSSFKRKKQNDTRKLSGEKKELETNVKCRKIKQAKKKFDKKQKNESFSEAATNRKKLKEKCNLISEYSITKKGKKKYKRSQDESSLEVTGIRKKLKSGKKKQQCQSSLEVTGIRKKLKSGEKKHQCQSSLEVTGIRKKLKSGKKKQQCQTSLEVTATRKKVKTPQKKKLCESLDVTSNRKNIETGEKDQQCESSLVVNPPRKKLKTKNIQQGEYSLKVNAAGKKFKKAKKNIDESSVGKKKKKKKK